MTAHRPASTTETAPEPRQDTNELLTSPPLARKSVAPRYRTMGLDGLAMLIVSSIIIILTAGLSLLACFIYVLRKAWLWPNKPSRNEKPTLAIVLGVFLRADGSLPNDFILRLRRAITLDIAPILILGGATRGPNFPRESEAGRNWLLDQGIAPDTIQCESTSRSTLENLTSVRSRLNAQTDRPVIISNRYHLARLEIMARGLGLPYPLCPAEDHIPWSLSQFGKLLQEAVFIHWYYCGYWTARLLRHKGMLDRIS
ncbi:MAG: YdcF family protein [Alphaproteobacteria bacterium]|nr:YdcF family protein [Alphaproteobacteria bacterium]